MNFHLDWLSEKQSPSKSILDYLERENLFLVSLDDERIWFRYHHLFANLLRARLHLDRTRYGSRHASASVRLVGGEWFHP